MNLSLSAEPSHGVMLVCGWPGPVRFASTHHSGNSF